MFILRGMIWPVKKFRPRIPVHYVTTFAPIFFPFRKGSAVPLAN